MSAHFSGRRKPDEPAKDAAGWKIDVFGPQSFHNGDYTFYYNNIQDNVAKRIAAYLNSAK